MEIQGQILQCLVVSAFAEVEQKCFCLEIPGQAAMGAESSLTTRENAAEVSWRILQIPREMQDQGTEHKARTNCGRG